MDEATMPRPDQNSSAAVEGEMKASTTETLTPASKPNPAIEKVIVAVHGIGDQHSYATIQSVVNQFCGYYGEPAAVPLGSFHNGEPAYLIPEPFRQDKFGPLAFGEVYWAAIPREVAKEKHTLEEAKRWARTIIERVRLRWRWNSEPGKANCRDEDFRLTEQVLGEMIQTIAVVDRICFLADRAGLFTFDLRKLLDDYLGDVQLVAEFKEQREKILASFDHLLGRVATSFPNANIYFVSHSEGTVVTLLGLLRAFRANQPTAWTQKVRGLMTLGSPIDKHLALWPELFAGPEPAQAATPAPDERIEWRNYYDFGDPIGFKLDGIREWIGDNGWASVFHFEEGHDIGFTRYPLPGKAHVDYWTDEKVFKHFIGNVIEKVEPKAAPKSKSAPVPVEAVPRPTDKLGFSSLSYALPYIGVLALFFLAAFILVKAVTGAISYVCPPDTLDHGGPGILTGHCLFLRVSGLAALLAGITVFARVPRLTRDLWLRGGSLLFLGACAAYYVWSVQDAPKKLVLGVEIFAGGTTLAAGLLIALLAAVISRRWPTLGLTPLMLAGAAGVVIFVIHYLLSGNQGPLWPVLLATVGSLYLWWLAALIFDLVFVWHLYIRNSRLIYRLNQVVGSPYGPRTKPDKKKTAAAATPGTPPQPAHS
jgi:hypothetical protein